VAAPDELRKAYFEGYEDALKDRSAPAEVAEGAGELAQRLLAEADTWKGNSPIEQLLREAAAALRAAPSLSREEWGMVLNAIDALYCGPTTSPSVEALRSKVREAAKSHP
jgi:hypothetical protein